AAWSRSFSTPARRPATATTATAAYTRRFAPAGRPTRRPSRRSGATTSRTRTRTTRAAATAPGRVRSATRSTWPGRSARSGSPPSQHRYLYALANPTTLLDRTGLSASSTLSTDPYSYDANAYFGGPSPDPSIDVAAAVPASPFATDPSSTETSAVIADPANA